MTEKELIEQAITDFPEDFDFTPVTVKDALEVYYMNGSYDDVTGDMDSAIGHVYRIDRWLVVTNSQGFSDVYSFDTEEHAKEEFKVLDEEYSSEDDDDPDA